MSQFGKNINSNLILFYRGVLPMMVEMLSYMTLGMIIGMVISPVMMRTIKVIRQRRRFSKLLNEISKLQKTGQLHEMQHLF
jgi:hypothetical protein